MAEGYRFKEVRKGERGDVLVFAQAFGLGPERTEFVHHLSLVAVDKDNETLAAALCRKDGAGRFVIEIISGDGSVDAELVNELADRCLRKVQAEEIGSARLNSPTCGSTNHIWSHANWLDKIQETPPPEVVAPLEAEAAEQDADASSQAA